MPEQPNVIPGADVEADWGNLIRDRTVQRYASVAVRTSQNPSPQAGDLSYLADTGTIEYWDGAAWVLLVTPAQADASYLSLAGGTLTGSLVVGVVADPTSRTVQILRQVGLVDNTLLLGVTNTAGNEGAALIRAVQDGVQSNMYFGRDGLEVPVSIYALNGTALLPSVSFASDSDTGMYRSGANIVAFSAGGVQRMFLNANGPHFPNIETTGSAANAFILAGSSERLQRSTSARKYKTDIKKLVTKDRQGFLDANLNPVSFKHKGDGQNYLGFIADEVAEIDPRLGVYEGDEIENYDLRGVVAVLAAQVNQLRDQVAGLLAP